MKYFRIPLLWILAILALLAYGYLAQNEVPEKLNNLSIVKGGEMATVTAIMGAFAVLSLVLKGAARRTTNIVAGIVFAVGTLAVLVDAMNVNLYGVYNATLGAGLVVLVALVWLAFRLPRTRETAGL